MHFCTFFISTLVWVGPCLPSYLSLVPTSIVPMFTWLYTHDVAIFFVSLAVPSLLMKQAKGFHSSVSLPPMLHFWQKKIEPHRTQAIEEIKVSGAPPCKETFRNPGSNLRNYRRQGIEAFSFFPSNHTIKLSLSVRSLESLAYRLVKISAKKSIKFAFSSISSGF